MSSLINLSGEVIRGQIPSKEENPIHELIYMRDGLLTQSIHPNFSQQPNGVLFWKGDRLAHNKQLFEKMKTYAQLHGLTEVIHPATGERIDLVQFFTMIEHSIPTFNH